LNSKILAIESSCDDTSISILHDGRILSNIVASQAIHIQYGGVVPESASRAHMENILPVLNAALDKANTKLEEIDCIAVTRGPGLLGSLIVGITFAKGLALGLNKPLIEINHLQAHVASLLIDNSDITFPFLCLTVSGGHTQLVLVKQNLEMSIIGQTIDDAAGEAFDKIGKLLGLPYPAGPVVDKLSKLGQAKFSFPIAKTQNYDFSFSGLKTSVLYFLKKELDKNNNFITENLNDLCRSVQDTIINSLTKQLVKVMNEYQLTTIGIAGGVSANSGLRSAMHDLSEKNKWTILLPKLEYCTDNAAMIGYLANYKFENKIFADPSFTPLARYPISTP